MKPVFQTRFGDGHGNCFAACLASILEVPLGDIDFTANEGWGPICNEKLEPYGYRWLEVNLNVAVKYPIVQMYGQICVFTGKSPRGDFNHSVVGRLEGQDSDEHCTFATIHDPHPDGTGIVDGRPTSIGFFVPINPETLKLNRVRSGTRIFKDLIDGHENARFKDINLIEWSPTPWIIDVHFGDHDGNLERQIMGWLQRTCGPESSPIHEKQGVWKRSCVTIHGYSWVGFKTQKIMEEFMVKFQSPPRPATCVNE